jgi:hypothetical protein
MKSLPANRFSRLALFVAILAFVVVQSVAANGTYYIAPDGSDADGDGSAQSPWATIQHATESVPDDGSTIIVRDGLYTGYQFVERHFDKPLLITAENPYKARLVSPADRNRVFFAYDASNFTVRGLEMSGSGASKGSYLVHIGTSSAHHITFEDCIIRDSYDNDLIKINDQAHHITFRNCLLYNAPAGGDELFDVNAVQNVVIEDCILSSDMEASGREVKLNYHPYIVIKNSTHDPDNAASCRRIMLRRNIFCNWQGKSSHSYLLLGEDAKPFWEAQEVTIENNLFLFNNDNPSNGAITLKCRLRDINIRANTVSGTVVGWTAYAIRFSQERKGLTMKDTFIRNNIFADPAGKMPRLFAGERDHVRPKLVLENNLYFNGGRDFRHYESFLLRVPDDDPAAVVGDPMLADPGDTRVARWDVKAGCFESGSKTIREEFERIVNKYAALPVGSAAIDAAEARYMPQDDILGRRRDKRPDIGAYELSGDESTSRPTQPCE